MSAAWSRAKYPLQGYSKFKASQPLHSVDDKVDSDPTFKPYTTNTSFYPYQPATNEYHEDTSSVGHSDSSSRVGDDDIFSSSTLHSRTEGYTARPELSLRSAYYLQSAIERSPDHPPSPSIAHSDHTSEQVHHSSNGTPERTLRRSPKSRRLESAISTTQDEEHQAYPLESASRIVTLPQNSQWSDVLTAPARQAGSSQAQLNSTTAASPIPEKKPLNTIKTAEKPSEDSENKNTWRRGAYPIQKQTSIADLQNLPTPPQSPTRESPPETPTKAPVNQVQPDKPTGTANKPLRRQAYPLQAPASMANLRQAALSPVREGEETPIKQTAPQTTPQESGQTIDTTPVRRQGYPLQSPASTFNLQQNHEPSKAENGGHPAPGGPSVHETNGTGHARGRPASPRPVYPIQAPVSTPDLSQTQTQTPSAKEDANHENEPPHKDTQSTTKSTPGRPAYPLQAPASTVNLNQANSLSMTNGTEPDNKHEVPLKQPQPIKPVALVSPQWRRQAYPMQSNEHIPDSPRAESPDPSYKAHSERKQNQGNQHKDHPHHVLPKNIRALNDADCELPYGFNGRTIVVCLDGTGDKFDADNSNIIHLVSALKKDDPDQVTYYQAGIGTYNTNGLSSGFESAADMAVGAGLGHHVRDAYNFLMHTYKEGDKICIFGFSRGAYTARCLAGMVHKVGLLPPRNIQQVMFAYEFYKDTTPEGWSQSAEFKKTFCIDVSVYFLGCFDSVASVGIIPRQLPLSSTPTAKPRYFRHAMALDERRAKFKVCRYQKIKLEEIEGDSPQKKSQELHKAQHHPSLTDEEYDRIMKPEHAFDTDVLEVWFAGCHADVGGGAVANVERHKLAQIPLRWMIRQAFECDTGIIFQTKLLIEHGLDVHTLWPVYEKLKIPSHGPPPSFRKRYQKQLPPRERRRQKLVPTGQRQEGDKGEWLYHLKSHLDEDWTPEQIEDFYDALMPMNDQLLVAPSWWILEFLPVEYKIPISAGEVYTTTGMNLGRYRGVEDRVPKMHWTVMHRMEQLGYKIGVRTGKGVYWEKVI